MQNLTFRDNEIEMDFKEFENIEIKMPVIDKNGKEICQALLLIDHALNEWESIYAGL